MKNKLLEKRLELNISINEISKLSNCSHQLISNIETGQYKMPNRIYKVLYRVCKTYQMSISELIIAITSNYTYRQNNDEEFMKELENRPKIRKLTIYNNKNTKAKKYAKKYLKKYKELGFYNIADRTEYNKYCKENNINFLSVDEWHIIKKQIEEDFFIKYGITKGTYKWIESLTRCAQKVGFGNDYRKYIRWREYKKTHPKEMSLEEWSKFDDIKHSK